MKFKMTIEGTDNGATVTVDRGEKGTAREEFTAAGGYALVRCLEAGMDFAEVIEDMVRNGEIDRAKRLLEMFDGSNVVVPIRADLLPKVDSDDKDPQVVRPWSPTDTPEG